MYDLLIKNARVCDGTGAASYQGFVAIENGTIVEVGKGSANGRTASRVIDADGLVLAPGFVDPHTHYDAQIVWDPLVTSSPWHGVTTIVQGNCGVGVAPLEPTMREAVLRDLENIEDIPYVAMASAINGEWETFGEYLDAIQNRGLGINVAALVPLTPLRQAVMKEACMDRGANDEELKVIENIFRQALRDGGFGWSATLMKGHIGHRGRPVACRQASRREFETLCRVMAEEKRGIVELALDMPQTLGGVTDEALDLLKMVSEISGRRVTFLPIVNDPDDPQSYQAAVKKLGSLLDSGQVVPQILVKPLTNQFNLRSPVILVGFNANFKRALDLSHEESTALYQDPRFRDNVQRDLDQSTAGGLAKNFPDRVRVLDGDSPEVKELAKSGKTLAQIARERGTTVVDCWFDIALRDDLKTIFTLAAAAFEPEGTKNLIRDGRFLPGIGDGGAHVATIDDANYVTYFLGHWCRDNELVTMEEGIRMVTSWPADVFGISRRGRITVGNHADLVLMDFAEVGACPPEYVNDLPGGAKRLQSKSTGIKATIVNGQILYENGTHTGVLPGRMLRSGDL